MLAGLRPSIGIVGDALDNALCETTTGPKGPNAATAARFVAGRSAPWLTWKTSPRRGWSTPVTHNKVCEYPGGFNLRSERKRFTTRSA